MLEGESGLCVTQVRRKGKGRDAGKGVRRLRLGRRKMREREERLKVKERKVMEQLRSERGETEEEMEGKEGRGA